MYAKQKLTIHELKKLQHLLDLVDAAIILSLQNSLCGEETRLQLHKEKSKLSRLLLAPETSLGKYISKQQILALSQIIEIGRKFIPILHEKNLIGPTYKGV